jgi:vacuolar-type H+-ATPase subunit H
MAGAASRPVVLGPVGIGPLRSLLERFRRSAGVPASVGVHLTAELAPVFAILDDLERDAERLREQSRADADRRLQEAEVEARTVLDEGRQRALLERDETFSLTLHEADAELAAVTGQAAAEAESIRVRGSERTAALVGEVIARVLEAAP